MKIVVSGMLAGAPFNGGATWAVLQYVLGLHRLGHQVLVVEPVAPEAVVPPRAPLAASDNASYLLSVCEAFGSPQVALLQTETGETVGPAYAELEQFAADAALLLNVSGMLRDERLKLRPPVRVYVDLDPAFNQLWAAQGVDVGLDGHTHFATVGQNVGRGARVPTLGRTWIPTLPPVVVADWPVAQELLYPGLTTVANWRSYGSIEADGVHYGQKAHSFRRLSALPSLTPRPLRLALAIHPDEEDDLTMLIRSGWELVDPLAVVSSPHDYRTFIQGSWAELGVAKSGYVASRSGWFSDRSACYLASGRPVVAQDTGFGTAVPVGDGLLAFATAGEAAQAVAELDADYDTHARAARALALEHLDSDLVLTRLLDAVMP